MPDADLHDQTGDAHVVHGREAVVQARDVVVERVQRVIAERQERRGDRRHDRLQEQEQHPQERRRGAAPPATGSASGIHTISDEQNTSACSAKWMSPLCSAASTTTGMCVTITTRLKRIVAGRKRASQRTDRSSHGGESSHRAIQVGVPSSSSGAAMIEYTRCCTMCTENR